MMTITRRYDFCAAHQYWNDSWSQEKNEIEFGPDIYVHGHNYTLEVSISGKVNPENGFIINLKIIDKIVNEAVNLLDHSQIEKDIPWFKGKQPSSENLTIYFWEHIVDKLPKSNSLFQIRIYETPRIFTDYYGPKH
jgi:6-pyruvoyltetrahydropterin/6-carboxytetrahydropterin synthase